MEYVGIQFILFADFKSRFFTDYSESHQRKKIKKSYTECLKCGLPIHFQVHAATKKMTITLIFLRFNIHVPISKTPTEIIPAKVFRVPHDKITR